MAQPSDVLKVCYAIMRPRFKTLSFEQFTQYLKDFEIIPIELDHQIMGAILRKGTELHALTLPIARGRWFNKKALNIIKETINTHGKATTQVMNDYTMGHDFALRLGFKIEQIKDGVTHYIKV